VKYGVAGNEKDEVDFSALWGSTFEFELFVSCSLSTALLCSVSSNASRFSQRVSAIQPVHVHPALTPHSQ
jgi:hypothetical protein